MAEGFFKPGSKAVTILLTQQIVGTWGEADGESL